MIPRSPLDAWLAARMGQMDAPGLPDSTVEAWQMAELRRTLAWARHASPFFAQKLADVELHALRTRSNMPLLPRMTAVDIAAPGLLTVSQDDVARVVTMSTSGTSGPPKRLYFSEADLARTRDFFAVGMRTLCGAGDTILVLLPGRREHGVADLLTKALPDMHAHVVLPPEQYTPETLPDLVAGAHVTTLIAAPTQLAGLLGPLDATFRGRVRAVLSSGEPLPVKLRAAIASAWGCAVFDHWGMTETGYGGGVECAAHSGYHLREADLLIEVADPLTGTLLPDETTGEILVTTLGARALPLLRYRTGDAGRMLPGPCPCGSLLRRLDAVPGRLSANGPGVAQPTKGWSTHQ
ncbi:MAG: hypothetical protein AUJ49_08875 [Desulfovibrionaceae bacterium CG1_02_65_16]|nr:MAG: hypothetical protein AUJ49_08875 [Desulfovibrionaceae bacterium CG1_02_65_16]